MRKLYQLEGKYGDKMDFYVIFDTFREAVDYLAVIAFREQTAEASGLLEEINTITFCRIKQVEVG